MTMFFQKGNNMEMEHKCLVEHLVEMIVRKHLILSESNHKKTVNMEVNSTLKRTQVIKT